MRNNQEIKYIATNTLINLFNTFFMNSSSENLTPDRGDTLHHFW